VRTWTAANARCSVFTFKQGLLSAVGHDLEIEVGAFEVRWVAGAVDATFDARSLRVRGAIVGGRLDPAVLSARDRAQIDENARGSLGAASHPTIRLRAAPVPDPPPARLVGQLTLHGQTQEITVTLAREASGWAATGTIHQPDFGITPFSAMLGALRVKPEVRVALHLPD
jgi:polyisoprenoid-binding protein YceI